MDRSAGESFQCCVHYHKSSISVQIYLFIREQIRRKGNKRAFTLPHAHMVHTHLQTQHTHTAHMHTHIPIPQFMYHTPLSCFPYYTLPQSDRRGRVLPLTFNPRTDTSPCPYTHTPIHTYTYTYIHTYTQTYIPSHTCTSYPFILPASPSPAPFLPSLIPRVPLSRSLCITAVCFYLINVSINEMCSTHTRVRSCICCGMCVYFIYKVLAMLWCIYIQTEGVFSIRPCE